MLIKHKLSAANSKRTKSVNPCDAMSISSGLLDNLNDIELNNVVNDKKNPDEIDRVFNKIVHKKLAGNYQTA